MKGDGEMLDQKNRPVETKHAPIWWVVFNNKAAVPVTFGGVSIIVILALLLNNVSGGFIATTLFNPPAEIAETFIEELPAEEIPVISDAPASANNIRDFMQNPDQPLEFVDLEAYVAVVVTLFPKVSTDVAMSQIDAWRISAMNQFGVSEGEGAMEFTGIENPHTLGDYATLLYLATQEEDQVVASQGVLGLRDLVNALFYTGISTMDTVDFVNVSGVEVAPVVGKTIAALEAIPEEFVFEGFPTQAGPQDLTGVDLGQLLREDFENLLAREIVYWEQIEAESLDAIVPEHSLPVVEVAPIPEDLVLPEVSPLVEEYYSGYSPHGSETTNAESPMNPYVTSGSFGNMPTQVLASLDGMGLGWSLVPATWSLTSLFTLLKTGELEPPRYMELIQIEETVYEFPDLNWFLPENRDWGVDGYVGDWHQLSIKTLYLGVANPNGFTWDEVWGSERYCLEYSFPGATHGFCHGHLWFKLTLIGSTKPLTAGETLETKDLIQILVGGNG